MDRPACVAVVPPHARARRGFADEVAFQAAVRLAEARAAGRSPTRLLPWAIAIWVVLIALFVAIWSFFGALPPPPPPAVVPSASAS